MTTTYGTAVYRIVKVTAFTFPIDLFTGTETEAAMYALLYAEEHADRIGGVEVEVTETGGRFVTNNGSPVSYDAEFACT